MKDIGFRGTALNDLKSFNDGVKQQIGYNLHRIQIGKKPLDSKIMKTIGVGVREIRAKDKDGIYCAIYVASFKETVYVLHCFQKKEQKTRKQDLEIAKTRLHKLIVERKSAK
jgi:phage-related protein